MKRTTLVVLCALLAPPLFADSGQRLIPAGSLISCNTGDSRISTKNTAVGDPILCKVVHRRGDFMLPYDSYLGGELTEFKDPGHFVGKGWMQLEFDRLYVGGTAMPLDAKVVDVPGYKIDAQGRILGKGHAVRDTITWMIPILWPIDLIELPRRGPRPTLKAETALTLRLMEDIVVPTQAEPQRDPYGLIPRGQGADNNVPPPPQNQDQYQDQPQQPQDAYVPDQQQMAPEEYPAPPVMAYAPPPMPYPVPMPYPEAMPYYGGPMIYGQVVIGARAPMVAYGPRPYYSRPPAMAYGPRPGVGMGYAPRSTSAYGYGYGGRAMGGQAMQARAGGGAGFASRGGMSSRGGYRGR